MRIALGVDGRTCPRARRTCRGFCERGFTSRTRADRTHRHAKRGGQEAALQLFKESCANPWGYYGLLIVSRPVVVWNAVFIPRVMPLRWKPGSHVAHYGLPCKRGAQKRPYTGYSFADSDQCRSRRGSPTNSRPVRQSPGRGKVDR